MTWRAQGRSTFDRLRQGVKVRSGPLTVCWAQAPAEGSSPALAFAIGKRVGNAVVRNRLKRRLREAARRLEVLPAGLYLVRASPGAAALRYQEISDHLQHAVSLLASRQKTADLARPSVERRTEQDGM
ncbi:MAG: ribonuclease P protein component [Acidimicrobiales bacterium]